ncbi:MAG: GNAT family N-acetyltransferase [Parvibaculum sp.]|nr:GNAT family N-acetyltransferase [Parvibaculum sp.]
MTFLIRDFDPARDRAAALSFIRGSQAYEHEIEPNRRLDDRVADDYLPVLLAEVAARRGRIFVAERDGSVIGWAAITQEQNPVFVVEAARSYGYITELFVTADARGSGVGQALMSACEAEARRCGLKQIVIGVLSANKRTADIYERAGFQPYTAELRKYL